jgi:hypothetical protein
MCLFITAVGWDPLLCLLCISLHVTLPRWLAGDTAIGFSSALILPSITWWIVSTESEFSLHERKTRQHFAFVSQVLLACWSLLDGCVRS